jgi:hypothetical protein
LEAKIQSQQLIITRTKQSIDKLSRKLYTWKKWAKHSVTKSYRDKISMLE